MDTPTQVIVGNLGSPFVLAAGGVVTLETSYSGDASQIAAGLTAQWGDGATPVRFEINVPIPGDCNGDHSVDTEDLDACNREIFDGDGDL